MTEHDTLLRGATDIHCHVDFEFGLSIHRKIPESSWLSQARELGMQAVVLKSHWWPTTATAEFLMRDQPPSSPNLVSSITLNPVVGGLELSAVESAVAQGCRMIFLPTWGARADREMGAMSQRVSEIFPTFDPERWSDISILDEAARLTADGHALLEFCREHEIPLGTGHVGWRESLTLIQEARRIGFEQLVFNHPFSHSVDAPLEAVVQAARLGAWIEFPWTLIAPGRRTVGDVLFLMREVGFGRIIVSTDYFRSSSPPPPILFRMWLNELYNAGMSRESLEQVAVRNPGSILKASK